MNSQEFLPAKRIRRSQTAPPDALDAFVGVLGKSTSDQVESGPVALRTDFEALSCIEENEEEGKTLQGHCKKYKDWASLHPERADEVEKSRKQGAQRVLEFEEKRTVNALLQAFTRETQIRAQAPEKDVPHGVQSKLVHVVRHGQGFHNMLESMEAGPDGLAKVEGVVKNEPEVVVEEGNAWVQMETGDDIFTGARKIVGVETSGTTEFLFSYSTDSGQNWVTLPTPFTCPSAKAHKQPVFGIDKKGHAAGKHCTHVRVRSSIDKNATIELAVLIPAVARPELKDPSLTSKGRAEAEASHKDALASDLNPELVLVSPVTRATQTGLIVFQHLLDANTGKPKVPFIAHEGIHERGGENTCDWRRPLPDLKRDFPNVDYSLIEHVDDPLWSSFRESQSSIIERVYAFLLWLRSRPEKDVAIIAHCSVNFTMLNAAVDCSMDPELARWMCTAELRTMRIIWETPHSIDSKLNNYDFESHALADGLCRIFPNVVQLPHQCTLEVADIISVRRDFKEHIGKGRVAVVAAGGAGHEPFGAGFVGEGLLTAYVTGGMFASPSPGTILEAIERVSGSGGCMLLVMNYAGVRFNSGIAALKAEQKGIKVTQVLVADDVARPQHLKFTDGWEGRGVAGAVLAIKVAGASAERGDKLEYVTEVANMVSSSVKSMAVAHFKDANGEDKVDVGVGIHGEPGAERLPLGKFVVENPDYKQTDTERSAALRIAVTQCLVQNVLPVAQSQSGVVLLNNLGGMSELAMTMLTNSVCDLIDEKYGVKDLTIVKGTLVTSLNMCGASLSFMPLDNDDVRKLLETNPGQGTAWPGMLRLDKPLKLDGTAKLSPPTVTGGEGSLQMRRIVKEACRVLARPETIVALDEMDDVCGDGDCGTTHGNAARGLLEQLDTLPGAQAHEMLASIAKTIVTTGRGAIGGIYGLGLETAALHLKECSKPNSEPDLQDWVAAARAALESIKKQGGAREEDRTIVDAMAPAVQALEANVTEGIEKAMATGVLAAKKGAKATQHMVAKKGRATNVPKNQQLRWQDPGAVGFAKWLEAVQNALKD